MPSSDRLVLLINGNQDLQWAVVKCSEGNQLVFQSSWIIGVHRSKPQRNLAHSSWWLPKLHQGFIDLRALTRGMIFAYKIPLLVALVAICWKLGIICVRINHKWHSWASFFFLYNGGWYFNSDAKCEFNMSYFYLATTNSVVLEVLATGTGHPPADHPSKCSSPESTASTVNSICTMNWTLVKGLQSSWRNVWLSLV